MPGVLRVPKVPRVLGVPKVPKVPKVPRVLGVPKVLKLPKINFLFFPKAANN